MDIYSLSAQIESFSIPTHGLLRKLLPVIVNLFSQMKEAQLSNVAQCKNLIEQTVNDYSLTKEQENSIRAALASFTKVGSTEKTSTMSEVVSIDRISKFIDIQQKESVATALKKMISIAKELREQKDIASTEAYTEQLWNESLSKLRVKQEQLFNTMRQAQLPLPKGIVDPINENAPINDVLDYYLNALKTYTKDTDKGYTAYLPLVVDALTALKKKGNFVEKAMKLGDKDVNINIPKVNLATLVDEKTATNILGLINNKGIDELIALRDQAADFIKKVSIDTSALSQIEGSKLKHLNAMVQEADILILINQTL